VPPEQIAGKKVLELGCGHGLPGVLAAMAGAAEVHFADFNEEVLCSLTVHNVKANLARLPEGRAHPRTRFLAGDWQLVCESLRAEGCGYDVILSSETTYSTDSSKRLLQALESLIQPGSMAKAYVAAKSYYFGVGGGAQQFRQIVEDRAVLQCEQAAIIEDGSSNKREVLVLSRQPTTP